MKEYIISHEQLERLFGWIDQLTLLVHGDEAEPYIGKRLALYEQLEVPPVLRCKDCKYFDQVGWTDGITGDCMKFYEVYGYDHCLLTTTTDGFCAWGERKVVDE